MIELTHNARRMIDTRLPVHHRILYLRWLDNCNLSDDDHLDILDGICNVLRAKDEAQLTFRTISDYESWLIRNGLARRKAVLPVPRGKRVPVNRIWNETKLATLGQLLRNGVGVNEIADRLRVTPAQVRAAMNHHEVRLT